MSSHHVSSWVLDHSEAKAGERLILLSLASFCATEDWQAYPAVKTIATHCRMSERGVRYALRKLEDAGRLKACGKSNSGTTIYQIRTDAQADVDDRAARLADEEPSARKNLPPGKIAHDEVSQIAPEQEDEPEPVHIPSEQGTLDVGDEIGHDAGELLRRKTKVDGKVVTVAEMERATAALRAWNRCAGQSLGIGTQLKPLVMRIRERPSFDGPAYTRLVESAWRLRWWSDLPDIRSGKKRPSIGFVFGPKAFEQAIQAAAEEKARLESGEAAPPQPRGRFEVAPDREELL